MISKDNVEQVRERLQALRDKTAASLKACDGGWRRNELEAQQDRTQAMLDELPVHQLHGDLELRRLELEVEAVERRTKAVEAHAAAGERHAAASERTAAADERMAAALERIAEQVTK